jgi:hypothetical protein
MCRDSSSGTLRAYVNGVQIGSTTSNLRTIAGTAPTIGENNAAANQCNGYISNIRFSNTELYPSGTTFTPPTSELTADASTILLACQNSDVPTQEETGKTLTNSSLLSGQPKVIPPYGVDAGNTFGGPIQQSSQGYMYFPTGRTEERGRGVGLYAGGTTPSTDPTPQIASILIQSSGNSIQFGDLSVARYVGGTGASSTRGIFAGGATPTRLNTIDFVTISTQGNATDFGDTQQVVSGSTGVSNSTRMVNAGGDSPAPTLIDVMGFLTIASLGDATDFGNLSVARAGLAGGASPTRGVFGGGWSAVPAYTGNDTIDFITIATTGNAADFGNLTTARRSVSGGSSQTRAIFMGGKSGSNPSSTKTNIIDFVTIASTGDATDFGDLTATVRDSGQTMSNSIRACKAAGYNSPATVNNIDMVTIATTGNAVDFGDTVIPVYSLTGLSDSHGGLS